MAVLLIYLVLYYYQLNVRLLQKALWLAGAGVLLLLMRVVVRRLPRLLEGVAPAVPTHSAASPRGSLRAAVIGGGAAAVVLVGGQQRYLAARETVGTTAMSCGFGWPPWTRAR